MVPHTRRSGCVALLDPFSLRETPVELCAEGEIRGCAQPPKTSTFAYPQPLQRRIKYGATPTSVLSPSAKPDPENAQTMHHEIQDATHPPKRVCGNIRFSHSTKPPSKESADKARAKYGRARSHPGPQPSRIPNPYNDESSTAPHPLRQRTTKHRSAQPPKTPTLEYPQPIRRRNKYGATHPLQWIFSLRKTPVQRIHGQGPGEIQACAQPPKTLTLDYSQPIQRGDLKYGATHPPKRTFMVPWNLWIMVEDEDVDGFPRGPPGFFNPFLYPAAFTPMSHGGGFSTPRGGRS
ncbi:hypothetical protein BS47DRAFT_1357275 [Hydnum rufescens UP504]|uniref:Uncharacterized protein n=1 Tax=Hydnum rufescens UP504 TaxID=1448309 RepID=A0A9P6BB27_9AGAM|nr:hypothetical protein BS47DRAFT_1357275 [Hydnum rufescens UP504]